MKKSEKKVSRTEETQRGDQHRMTAKEALTELRATGMTIKGDNVFVTYEVFQYLEKNYCLPEELAARVKSSGSACSSFAVVFGDGCGCLEKEYSICGKNGKMRQSDDGQDGNKGEIDKALEIYNRDDVAKISACQEIGELMFGKEE